MQCESGQHSRCSDSLWAGRSGDRIPVGERFSVLVQTGPGAHPASRIMCGGSFRGVKLPGRGFNQPPSSSPRKRVEVHLYVFCRLCLHGLFQGETYLFFLTLQEYSRCIRFPEVVQSLVMTLRRRSSQHAVVLNRGCYDQSYYVWQL